MPTRIFLLPALYLASFVLTLRSSTAKPNILVILADDQAYNTVRALGNNEIETPHLDKLVASGTTFTHAYNMGGWNGAICMASRMMLMTGQYVWDAERDYAKMDELFRKPEKLWPQLLAAAGYDTWFSGKWHINVKAGDAFGVARHVRPGMPNQTDEGYNRPIDGKPDPWSPYDPKFEGFWKGGRHWSEVLADDGVDYLQQAATNEAPFLMYLAFNAPHDPRQSPKEYIDKYPSDQIAIPKSYLPEYPFDIGSNKIRDEKLAPFPRTHHAVQVNRREYYAIITHMDAQIGRILNALKATGKEDDTYIFFGADHGLAVGHHGLMGKQNMFDHSMRVPLVAVGPGITPGARIDTPVYLQDIMATTLELAAVEKPAHVRYHSLKPLWEGSKAKPYPAIYGAYVKSQRMVSADGFKLIVYPNINRALLFDLKNDPAEMHDLAGDPAHANRKRILFDKLLELQRECNDTLDLKKAFPKGV